LRRHDPVWDETLRTYLFTAGPITELEDAATTPDGARPDDLGLGSLSRSAAR
jgi:uncharacterized protein